MLHLGAIAQVVPLVAAAAARRRVRGARAWVLAWCGLLVVVDGAALWLGYHGTSNIVLFNLATPAGPALVLWALAYWQAGDLSKLTFRLAIVPFLLVWGVLTFAFESTSSFSSVAGPLTKLVGLGAATFTLLAGSRRVEGMLHCRDWFWISGGMALYFGAAAALSPLSALLVGETPQLVVRAYEVKSVLDVFAFLAIARGVTCPVET